MWRPNFIPQFYKPYEASSLELRLKVPAGKDVKWNSGRTFGRLNNIFPVDFQDIVVCFLWEDFLALLK
jgi:hypothetical protein